VLLLGTLNWAQATEESTMNELDRWAQEHTGSEWAGSAELWIDPAGNEVETSDATLQVRADGVEYTWAWRGAPHTGELSWGDDGFRWRDSWHQPETVELTAVAGQGALLAAEYSYPAGAGPDWQWRIKLAQRPDESLVLQMTNIAPWGEEARAVRMVLRRSE
jgi:hypothetical protein